MPARVRALLVGALRAGAGGGGPSRHRARRRADAGALARAGVAPSVRAAPGGQSRSWRLVRPASAAERRDARLRGATGRRRSTASTRPSADARAGAEPAPAELLDRPLGAARAQLHETYIVAQTRDGVVIVDQHAAHERLVYERLKAALANGGVARQVLLIPEIVELDADEAAALAEAADELAELGLVLEAFGPGAVLVREVPALLGDTDVKGLVRDLARRSSPRRGRAAALLKERLDGGVLAPWPATAACAPGGG